MNWESFNLGREMYSGVVILESGQMMLVKMCKYTPFLVYTPRNAYVHPSQGGWVCERWWNTWHQLETVMVT